VKQSALAAWNTHNVRETLRLISSVLLWACMCAWGRRPLDTTLLTQIPPGASGNAPTSTGCSAGEKDVAQSPSGWRSPQLEPSSETTRRKREDLQIIRWESSCSRI